MTDKISLEGELFTLVEEDDTGVHVCAEISGINVWDWLEKHTGTKVKLNFEVEEKL